MGNSNDFHHQFKLARFRRRDYRLRNYSLSAILSFGFRLISETIFEGLFDPLPATDYVLKPYGRFLTQPSANNQASIEIVGFSAKMEVTLGSLMLSSSYIRDPSYPSTQMKTRYAMGTCTSLSLTVIPPDYPTCSGKFAIAFIPSGQKPFAYNHDEKEIPTFEDVKIQHSAVFGSAMNKLVLRCDVTNLGSHLRHYTEWDTVVGVIMMAYQDKPRDDFLNYSSKSVAPGLAMNGVIILDELQQHDAFFDGSVHDQLKNSAISMEFLTGRRKTFMKEGFKIKPGAFSGPHYELIQHGEEEEVIII